MRLLQDTLHCVMLVRVREEFTSCWEVEEEEEEEVVVHASPLSSPALNTSLC